MSSFESPIPLSEIETVLAWVDTFKLTRPTKKINRDFSDAVLLAEILSGFYPKLVEMHNYPPRNSHALKLNNWMTLNRKVLKKLKLNLCVNTMEQLANSVPGVIERVLVMVRDKIRRDEELIKSLKEGEQNTSSGGSYYEAVGDEEHVLVVPVKTRINGVLEMIQQKVVNYEMYLALKEELKDAKDARELLKQKVEHLDNMLKVKDERIEELQKQLDRKQARRKEVEALQNSLSVPIPIETSVSLVPNFPGDCPVQVQNRVQPIRSCEAIHKVRCEESKIPVLIDSASKLSDKLSDKLSITEVLSTEFKHCKNDKLKTAEASSLDLTANDIKSKVVADKVDIEIVEEMSEGYQDSEEFKDSLQEAVVTTIEETIQKEICELVKPMQIM